MLPECQGDFGHTLCSGANWGHWSRHVRRKLDAILRGVKAFLLAAGLGTRLRPITASMPKCLVRVAGKPMLDHWLDALPACGVDRVLVNLHHLAALVEQHVHARSGAPEVVTFLEPRLLGSAGTVATNREFVGVDESFLVVYGDNFTDADLRPLLRFHATHQGLLTMGLFETQVPRQCGIVDLDGHGRVVDFAEKPEHPRSNLANAGIYVARRQIFDHLPAKRPADFGHDVLPGLVGRMYGWRLEGYYRDIGTLESLALANRDYEARFGYIFIVCATGRSAEDMLAIMEQRLTNGPDEELQAAAEEQRQITRLRLAQLLT